MNKPDVAPSISDTLMLMGVMVLAARLVLLVTFLRYSSLRLAA